MVQQQTVSDETLKAIANAFNAHDLDVIMDFFADDCSLDMPRGPEPWGPRFIGKAAKRGGGCRTSPGCTGRESAAISLVSVCCLTPTERWRTHGVRRTREARIRFMSRQSSDRQTQLGCCWIFGESR